MGSSMIVALLSASVLGFTAAVPPARRAVVVTTDCGAGFDDQWALAHLALSPEFDLRGVVTTHAPNLASPAAETSARAARELLGRLPLDVRPRVLAGSSRPLAEPSRPLANPGVAFLIEQARGRSSTERLTVVVLGAATDVASALLIEPTLADRMEIVAMGFEAWPGGKDPWNVKNDVRAWQVLLRSRAPIVVGDAAVCQRLLTMTRTRAHALLDGLGSPAPDLVALLEGWLARNARLAEETTGSPDTCSIWDEVTVAYLRGLTRSETHPRPALRDDLTFDHTQARGTITWVTSVDADRLWADLARKVGRVPHAPSPPHR